tara:strand:+ start:289 stop:1143 length:855 start_codon:yes stop_codon:yes gene_type:complete
MRLHEIEHNTAEDSTAAFIFGRFNPPTIGHKKLFDKLKSVNPVFFVFATKTQDKKSNPLAYAEKIAAMDAQFPEMADYVINDPNIRTIIDVMQFIEKAGHTNVIMVAGSDRVQSFDDLLQKYNGKEYNFKSIKVVSAGERDPDSDSVSGVSASKAREAAKLNDFDQFQTMFAGNEKVKRKIFDMVRQGMGLSETKEAPKGTYFTKTGNLVKGRLTKAAKARGARETDPKDKQRSKVPPVTQRNPEEAAGVGIVTKQNATKDVPVGGEYMNVKKLSLHKKPKKKK